MNTYKLNAVCTCPADSKPDSYSVVIESRRMLWTNEIGAAIDELAAKVMPQEQFTWELHRKLQARVTTVGAHPSFTDGRNCSPITIECTEGEA